MKANELMIEDWVYNKNIDKPMQVYPMMFSQMFRRTPNATTENYNIFPIPLTPEILEKNGFTKELDADGLHYWYTLIDGHIKFSILYVRSVFKWLGPLDFKYVHELQHALRLCGIEKEIIL